MIDALAVEIKARRLELRLTQEDLAGRCEIDRPFISLIEVGKKQPSISVLYALCKALDSSFGEFAKKVEARYQKQTRANSRRQAKPN